MSTSRKLSFFVTLAVLVGCSRQTVPTIIHICDYHFVDRDAFAADLRDQDQAITDAEIDSAYAEFLDTVESVQTEQMKILRELIQKDEIRRVFVEGLADDNQEQFRAEIGMLKEHEADFQRAIDLLDQTDDPVITETLQRIINAFRLERLQLGAVAQLIASTELDAALPLEDARIMEAADPAKQGFQFDTAANAHREREMVKRMLKSGPVTVVVLGGGHDLADEIKVRSAKAVYRRIEPETWQRASQ